MPDRVLEGWRYVTDVLLEGLVKRVTVLISWLKGSGTYFLERRSYLAVSLQGRCACLLCGGRYSIISDYV